MALTYVVPAPGETTGSILDERGGLAAHVYANDPLGRKLAAAPELVEACGDDLAGHPLAVLLGDVAFVLDGFGQNSLAARCRMRAKQVRAALEKAGVEP